MLLCTFPWFFLATNHLNIAMVESERWVTGACPPCSLLFSRVTPLQGHSRHDSAILFPILAFLISLFSCLFSLVVHISLLVAIFPISRSLVVARGMGEGSWDGCFCSLMVQPGSGTSLRPEHLHPGESLQLLGRRVL